MHFPHLVKSCLTPSGKYSFFLYVPCVPCGRKEMLLDGEPVGKRDPLVTLRLLQVGGLDTRVVGGTVTDVGQRRIRIVLHLVHRLLERFARQILARAPQSFAAIRLI